MFMPFVEKNIAQSRFASQWVCFSCFYGQNGLASVVLLVKMDLFQLFYWSKWTCFSCSIGQNRLVSVVLLVKMVLFQLFSGIACSRLIIVFEMNWVYNMYICYGLPCYFFLSRMMYLIFSLSCLQFGKQLRPGT